MTLTDSAEMRWWPLISANVTSVFIFGLAQPSGLAFLAVELVILNFILLYYQAPNPGPVTIHASLAAKPMIAALIGVALASVLVLRKTSSDTVLLLGCLILGVALQDFTAKFVGRQAPIGQLMPKVSPNKTASGAVAGFVVANIALGSVIAMVWGFEYLHAVPVILLLGQFGDLFFSNIKRLSGVKDFGTILGRQGGVLDRMDSLVFPLIFIHLSQATNSVIILPSFRP